MANQIEGIVAVAHHGFQRFQEDALLLQLLNNGVFPLGSVSLSQKAVEGVVGFGNGAASVVPQR
jgi:hypothetical protein